MRLRTKQTFGSVGKTIMGGCHYVFKERLEQGAPQRLNWRTIHCMAWSFLREIQDLGFGRGHGLPGPLITQAPGVRTDVPGGGLLGTAGGAKCWNLKTSTG